MKIINKAIRFLSTLTAAAAFLMHIKDDLNYDDLFEDISKKAKSILLKEELKHLEHCFDNRNVKNPVNTRTHRCPKAQYILTDHPEYINNYVNYFNRLSNERKYGRFNRVDLDDKQS